MSWVYLIVAGLLEMGWPLGLKIAQEPGKTFQGVLMAVFFMTASGILLFLAQRHIPIGTAYAVWTGLGAAGTFIIGVMVFGDPNSLMRYVGVALILAGAVTLKLAH